MAKKKEEELQVVLISNIPAVPEELDINGLKVSKALIQEKVKEAKLIVIKDFDDKANYELAKEQKQLFVKFRTQSEKWRKAGVAPINEFLTNLKSKTDSFGTEAKIGEDHLDAEIKKYEDWEAEEKKRKQEEKQKRTNERTTLIIAAGGVFSNGSYTFPHDAGLLVSGLAIADYKDKEWDELYDEVKTSWDAEVQRKADEDAETERLKNENLLQAAANNEKRTKLRYKELTLEGFELVSPSNYHKNDILISEDDVLNKDDDAWDALIADANEEVSEDEPAAVQTTYPTPPTIGDDFDDEPAGEITDVEFETAPPDVEVYLPFYKETPFIEFPMGNMKMRIFPVELENEATSDLTKSNVGAINNILKFALFKTEEQ